MLARPGIVAATSTGEYPARLRAQGAQTIYWDMNLRLRVGTTTEPYDPATIEERANRLFVFAASQTQCATPWIALNELNGANLETPWTPNNAQYRDNVLRLVRALAARGARPFLLISSTPYTGTDEAATWWRNVAAVSDVVPEVYFNGRSLAGQGPLLANRRLRAGLRRGVARLVEIGIPVTRIGLMLGFQSAAGTGGREGLRPREEWFRVDQVAGAGRARDRGRDERRNRVVVGVGDVQRGRPRPRQARRRLRLPLGEERAALQRAREAGRGLQRVPRRRPAPAAGHRDVQDRREHDRHERDREAEPRRAGPRRRLQRAARAARRDVRRAGDRTRDPCGRARGDRAALRRQPLVVRCGAREVARVRRGRPQRPRRPAPAAQARGEAACARPERREHRRLLLLVSRAARATGSKRRRLPGGWRVGAPGSPSPRSLPTGCSGCRPVSARACRRSRAPSRSGRWTSRARSARSPSRSSVRRSRPC